MIIPTHCKSCGKPIAHLWFRYLDMLYSYQNNGEPDRTPEARALDELNIVRYCCRVMFLCQPEDLVDMIKNRVQ